MPYISLDNLTQYNGRLRDYIDGSFDKLDGANWRKTSAAQSVSCWPIPESPLEPEVTFKFSETPPASGTKGPDNPSTIVGVEAVACHVCESAGVEDTPYFIGLGDTYYGGSVNFATGVMTVTHKAVVLTGSESWNSQTLNEYLRCYIAIDFHRVENLLCSCTHYQVGYGVDKAYINDLSGNAGLFIGTDGTIEDLKAFLAEQYANGTPVVFVAQVPESEYTTVPLTPVLVRSLPALSHYVPRQNTIYTPHESVQVGYAKSALKTSEELTNAIISLGGNV